MDKKHNKIVKSLIRLYRDKNGYGSESFNEFAKAVSLSEEYLSIIDFVKSKNKIIAARQFNHINVGGLDFNAFPLGEIYITNLDQKNLLENQLLKGNPKISKMERGVLERIEDKNTSPPYKIKTQYNFQGVLRFIFSGPTKENSPYVDLLTGNFKKK
jgi:hypothetical protein